MKSNSEICLENISKYVIYNKYARYIPDLKRRETWEEIIDRNKAMHVAGFPALQSQIEDAYELVYDKQVLPSMRSLQFAGKAVTANPARLYNCAYLPISHPYAFAETMFLLLGGSGVGYSVQQRHIKYLPPLQQPGGKQRYIIHDSIEGWADAVKRLLYAYFYGKPEPVFEYSEIRPKGTPLLTAGGKAPGQKPLENCLVAVQETLETALAENCFDPPKQLTSLQVHDILCHIADAVKAGGTRRSSLIAFFDFDDTEMATCKQGEWWKNNGQRAMANNSAVILRSKITESAFMNFWKNIEASGCGEPGFYFTNNPDVLGNPCVEISLPAYCFCNLCEINTAYIRSQKDLNRAAQAAALIGTLQASYTDFHYLRPQWRKTTEENALLGIGLTGIASGSIMELDLKETAFCALIENERVADLIGIKKAARVTTVKPSGTASLVAKCSSGVHGWFSEYYKRRIRVGKEEAVYNYLKLNHPNLLEDEIGKEDTTAIVTFPVKAPEDAVHRTESPIEQLERVKKLHKNWIQPGHRSGENTNNVSCTAYVKEDEWANVGQWAWENRDSYNGLAFLPYDGGNYIQAPNEEISKEEYEKLVLETEDFDLSLVYEDFDNTNLVGEVACAGGACDRV